MRNLRAIEKLWARKGPEKGTTPFLRGPKRVHHVIQAVTGSDTRGTGYEISLLETANRKRVLPPFRASRRT